MRKDECRTRMATTTTTTMTKTTMANRSRDCDSDSNENAIDFVTSPKSLNAGPIVVCAHRHWIIPIVSLLLLGSVHVDKLNTLKLERFTRREDFLHEDITGRNVHHEKVGALLA